MTELNGLFKLYIGKTVSNGIVISYTYYTLFLGKKSRNSHIKINNYIDEILYRRVVIFDFSNKRMEEESKRLSENLNILLRQKTFHILLHEVYYAISPDGITDKREYNGDKLNYTSYRQAHYYLAL